MPKKVGKGGILFASDELHLITEAMCYWHANATDVGEPAKSRVKRWDSDNPYSSYPDGKRPDNYYSWWAKDQIKIGRPIVLWVPPALRDSFLLPPSNEWGEVAP